MTNNAQAKALVIGVGPEEGLGGALCHRFAKEGLHVFIAGRSREKIGQVEKSINEAGSSATAVVCDATSEEAVTELFNTVQGEGDAPLELAVFNVGNNRPGLIKDMDASYFEEAWRSVCFSGFLFGRAASNAMQATGGTLLFTGASASLRGKANFGAFNAAKAALRAFTQALAKEQAEYGLHVAHVIVDGRIAGQKAFDKSPELLNQQEKLISLEGLTDAYWFLHQQEQQAWTFEMDLRTSREAW